MANGSVLEEYHGALYVGIGLSALGFIVGVGYVIHCMSQEKKKGDVHDAVPGTN